MARKHSDPATRFWPKVRKTETCWLWTGSTQSSGYPQFNASGRLPGLAHRFAYELLVGPIPEGLTIDHVKDRGCTSKLCVNPAHLEIVSRGVNSLRGGGTAAVFARRTHCGKGHEFTEANTVRVQNPKGGTFRRCVACSGRKVGAA